MSERKKEKEEEEEERRGGEARGGKGKEWERWEGEMLRAERQYSQRQSWRSVCAGEANEYFSRV